ncbi:MAG TPA: DNA polymerase III subunit gamma/tau [Patescibacteria group bacterium]|nr:DNA polymerase III subunit gamma/tau [Patescibacteria group bacterium]
MAKKADATPAEKPAEYRVLARKYRPRDFSQLKGQDALVRTLTNAIESGRIAHAFMLTGVRGVGKTTTARIIARALNCEKGPTVTPCGTCDQCKAISEDRHVDVLEMDAASHTGVDNIRDLIDTVQYAPVSGRYKIFIIDEVHMLSKGAFNALLKTLEEPPAHAKFVFATTEIRKVPVTVLSRCQRFDLKRIDAGVLETYFTELLGRENVEAEPQAVALIARAADGSARDGLSLLDQAISREPGKMTEAQVRDMLGLVDRTAGFDLFENVMKGDTASTLALVDNLYKSGADPVQVVQDMLDLTHFLTKTKVAPESAKDRALPEAERVRGAELAKKLSVPVLTRSWQMLLKGVSEVNQSSQPRQALEMLLIRMLYVAEQPTPGDVLKQLKDGTSVSMGGGAAPLGGAPRGTTVMRSVTQTAAVTQAHDNAAAHVNNFQEAVALFGQKKEGLIEASISTYVHLVKFEQGHLAIRLKEGAPQNLVGQMSDRLSLWTGRPWVVSLSREQGEPTIADARRNEKANIEAEVRASVLVAEAMNIFPGAKVIDIKLKK